MSQVSGIRYDWYQSESDVMVTLKIKGVQKEKCVVDFGNSGQFLEVTVKDGSEDEIVHFLHLNLSHNVNPAQSSFRCFPSKVEVKMRKTEGGRWEKLESSSGHSSMSPSSDEQSGTAVPVPSAHEEIRDHDTAHIYPTSSTKGPKNWDKIEKEVKEEEEKEDLQGDAAVNRLFQNIYKDASDEVKKAMLKSFTESRGTVLSTNWNEVSQATVECKPPDGMEFKKWS